MALLNRGPFLQESAPAGGYPKIDIARKTRVRGPPGWALWLGFIGYTSYGFLKLVDSNQKRSAILTEKRSMRACILPIVWAEQDRKDAAKKRQLLKEEAEIMEHVDGWVVGQSVYKTKAYQRPSWDHSYSD